MSATGGPATRTRRIRPAWAHPTVTGRAALWALIVVNLVIVELMIADSTPAKNTLIGIGQFLGLHASLAMILQVVLVARLPFLDRRIGMDRLTTWHRWTGLSLFWLVLLHPTFIVLGYAQLYQVPVPAQIADFAGIYQTLLGLGAAATVVVVVALSVRFARRRLPYELWHAIHLLLYVAIALALLHQLLEGTTFKTSPLTTIYWWTLWTAGLGSLLVGRVIVPLRRNSRHKLRVAAVVPESDQVVSVYVTGRDLDRLRARAGQFFIWRFPAHSGWWRANPFSLSAAPDGESLRLTVKAVGSTSARLRHLQAGTRVFVEGPYGAFTAHARATAAALLIAGGVGITPVRALLEELAGPVTVIYRVRSAADAVLLAEVRQLAEEKGVALHVVSGRTAAGARPFEPENLLALVPDLRARDTYVCGPPAMTEAVLRSLRRLGVPWRQVHAERFSLAG